MKPFDDPHAALDELTRLYDASIARLRADLAAFVRDGRRPDAVARADGAYVYPELRVIWSGAKAEPGGARSYARLSQTGAFATTITRPDLYRPYLLEQLGLLAEDYGATFEVGPSRQEIPYPYVLDALEAAPNSEMAAELPRLFPVTELAHIGDEIADGAFEHSGSARPLSLFDGLRTDYSLARLRHYTGAPVEDVQSFILFTNYHRYVDEFVRWACAELVREGSPYTHLSCAGGVKITRDTADPVRAVSDAAWRKHQMPAYHLVAPGWQGVSLVNIGVGPSNAKTICDHLAVTRPHAWLMIGHCGGLRGTQKIGDYVLAHAYVRDDHVMDDVLPVEVPIPPIAEVQQALQRAAETVTGEDRDQIKNRLRTGTVVTTDDRNWELRYSRSALRFSQSRAVAVDMESATVSAQGYRFRVPYGTLLCVSDKPLHGEIKLPGQANRFYEGSISEHLQIGLEAIDLLRQEGPRLHSRKLRAFDEPPFR
ncbi:AMP nucleosidase [Brevundimonas sp. 2R-24]|uniref:AMP nucleosidase n=1 Tax=Peiella sedimenti TaxID=3061083 RepID=A0ABT8SKD9_9CAUL|nr:AMP nucleosidase [Caulobacteraceae bacterium XZ-24]